MKKAFILFLAALMIAGLFAGCGGEKEKTIDDIKEAGVLKIATSPDFPPFEELKGDGSVEGIEIELLEKICQELGVELEINQMNFDSVIPGVQAGKFDMGVSGISITEKRQKSVLFTDPYCLAAQAIVVVEGSDITSKEDLDGKTIAVQSGTTAETFCTEEGYTVNSYAANSDAQQALLIGKVDAWVIDDLTAADMVAVNNEEGGTKLAILDEAMTTEPYAFAMAFGSEKIIEEINTILNGLISDGTVEALFEKYNAPYTSPNE